MNRDKLESIEQHIGEIPNISQYFAYLAINASQDTIQLGTPEMDVAAKLATSIAFQKLAAQFA